MQIAHHLHRMKPCDQLDGFGRVQGGGVALGSEDPCGTRARRSHSSLYIPEIGQKTAIVRFPGKDAATAHARGEEARAHNLHFHGSHLESPVKLHNRKAGCFLVLRLLQDRCGGLDDEASCLCRLDGGVERREVGEGGGKCRWRGPVDGRLQQLGPDAEVVARFGGENSHLHAARRIQKGLQRKIEKRGRVDVRGNGQTGFRLRLQVGDQPNHIHQIRRR